MPADVSGAPATSARVGDPRAAAAALAAVEPRPGVPKPDPILVADGVAGNGALEVTVAVPGQPSSLTGSIRQG